MFEPETPFRKDPLPAAVVLQACDQQGCEVRNVPPPAIRISVVRARLRRMVGQGLQIALPAIDATLTVQLTDDPPADWPAALTLYSPDGRFDIEEGARLLRVLTGIDVDLPAAGDGAHAEWLLSEVLARLAGTPFESCDRIAASAAPLPNDCETLRLVLRSAGHLVSTRLRADAGDLASLLARGSWTPLRQPLSAFATLPMHVDVHIGSHVLSAASLRLLSAGDILLPERVSFNAAGEGWLDIGPTRLRVHYAAPGTLAVLEIVRGTRAGGGSALRPKRVTKKKGKKMKEHELDQEQPEGQGENARQPEPAHGGEAMPLVAQPDATAGNTAPDQSVELDGMAITLQFLLGKVRMPLGDMRTLAPGAILLFDGSPESVAIVASERTLGRGEVVDVDGRLGIRITHWRYEGE